MDRKGVSELLFSIAVPLVPTVLRSHLPEWAISVTAARN